VVDAVLGELHIHRGIEPVEPSLAHELEERLSVCRLQAPGDLPLERLHRTWRDTDPTDHQPELPLGELDEGHPLPLSLAGFPSIWGCAAGDPNALLLEVARFRGSAAGRRQREEPNMRLSH